VKIKFYKIYAIKLKEKDSCPMQLIHHMEEAQGQAQMQAQQREDLGLPLELWPRRFKKTGIWLLTTEKPPNICSKMP